VEQLEIPEFDPAKPERSIAWFRGKLPIASAEWDELDAAAREKAFTVSGVADLDLVADVLESLKHAMQRGETLEDFKARIADQLEDAWDGTVADPAWRLETIFRTNLQSAYNAGRWLEQQDVADDRPYALFDATQDERTCPICGAADGTILPLSHPWWHTHVPPMHFACRCSTISLTEEQAHSMGVTPNPTSVQPADGFGAPPGVRDWQPDRGDYPPDLWSQYERVKHAEEQT